MVTKRTETSDPIEHTKRLKSEFKFLVEHLREDIMKVDDPEAKALFEVSAEVIEGLSKAFTDYENKNEKA
jgi:hypothetical protein